MHARRTARGLSGVRDHDGSLGGQEVGALVSLSACDPLNLVGIVTPGERVPAITSNRVLFKDGVPVARKVGGTVEILSSVEGGERWALETALVRKPVPVRLRA